MHGSGFLLELCDLFESLGALFAHLLDSLLSLLSFHNCGINAFHGALGILKDLSDPLIFDLALILGESNFSFFLIFDADHLIFY